MAFTWTYKDDPGDQTVVDSIKEMRDNCDYLLDNEACISHNSGVDVTYNSSVDTSDWPSNNASNLAGVLWGNNGSVNGGYYTWKV